MLGATLSPEEVEEFMAAADTDGNGKLDYDEFVKMMLQEWNQKEFTRFLYIYTHFNQHIFFYFFI